MIFILVEREENGVRKNPKGSKEEGKKKRTKTTKDNANFLLKCSSYYIKFNWTEDPVKGQTVRVD